jgi:hypothetical protein
MPLINSFHPDSIPLDQIPGTAGQIARLRCYAREAFVPINFEQQADRLEVLLARMTDCSESGKRWYGRIRVTLAESGKVIASTVYPAEVVKMATADEPPKRAKKTAKPKAEQPQFWIGQLVRIPAGNRAWIDAVLEDGKVAVEVEGLGKDVYPADVLTPIETEPPASEPELPTSPTYQPGARIRFIGGEHDELTGTMATIEQVGGARLLVRSDELGLVTVGVDAVELAEDVQPSKAKRSRQKRAKSA